MVLLKNNRAKLGALFGINIKKGRKANSNDKHLLFEDKNT